MSPGELSLQTFSSSWPISTSRRAPFFDRSDRRPD
jgi:hypothetical protein